MKLLLIIVILINSTSVLSQNLFYKPGQTYDAKKTIDEWDGGPAFDVKEVPVKWKNESGVIIATKTQYHIHSKNGMSFPTTTNRYRIKIQDKVALEKFSKTFRKEMGYECKIKIEKPSGDEIFVSMNDLSEAKKNASSSTFVIPNLEVGDILDYCYFMSFRNWNNGYKTPNSFSIGNGNFPMLYEEVEWLIHKDFQFKIKAVNGVSIFEQNWYDDEENKVESPSDAEYRQVRIIEENIDRMEDNRYVYITRSAAYYRFRLFLTEDLYMDFKSATTELDKTETNFMKNEDIITFVYKEKKKLKRDFNIRSSLKVYAPDLNKKSDGRNSKETLDIVEAIHHTIKYESQSMYGYETNAAQKPYRGRGVIRKLYGKLSVHIPAENFSSLQQMLLTSNEFDNFEIDYDIIALVSLEVGRIEEVMFESELKYALRINLPDGNKFYYSGHSEFNDYTVNNYLLEGAKGIVIEPFKKPAEYVKVQEIIFPISSHNENILHNKMTISISDDFKTSNIVKEESFKGKFKIEESYSLLGYPDIFEVYCEEYKEYPDNKREIDKERENVSEEIKKGRIERYEANLATKFEVESYDDITIINPGIKEGEPLVVKEKYVVTDLIKKGGENFIFNIGMLMDTQVALESDEYERDIDVFISYPKSFVNDITITLPEGYTVEDLSPLNVKLENEAGFFESTCVLEGNQIKFITTKNYKVNFLPAEKWPLMTEFLDIAFDLNQKKLLISKN